jgi:predicted PurR-regulated permease PerM
MDGSALPPAAGQPSLFARRRVRIGFLIAFALAGFLVAYRLRAVLNPLLLALLISYILQPIVALLERRCRLPRTAAVIALYAVAMALAAGIVIYSIGTTSSELDHFMTRAVGGWERAEPKATSSAESDPLPALSAEAPVYGDERLVNLASSPSIAFLDMDGDGQRGKTEPLFQRDPGGAWAPVPPEVDPASRGWRRRPGYLDDMKRALAHQFQRLDPRLVDAVIERAKANAATIASAGAAVWKWLMDQVFGGIFTIVGYFVLVPIYAFFTLRGYDSIVRSVDEHLPGVHRERIRTIARRIDRACAAFFRGRFLMCVGKAAFVSAGLWLIGVEFALTIGLVVGALALIPAVGPILGFGLSIVFSYGPTGWGVRVAEAAALFVLAETLEAVATPVFLGREVGLHPLAILIALFAFGDLFGLMGLLLAVPLAAIAKILAEELVLPELRHLAAERPPHS